MTRSRTLSNGIWASSSLQCSHDSINRSAWRRVRTRRERQPAVLVLGRRNRRTLESDFSILRSHGGGSVDTRSVGRGATMTVGPMDKMRSLLLLPHCKRTSLLVSTGWPGVLFPFEISHAEIPFDPSTRKRISNRSLSYRSHFRERNNCVEMTVRSHNALCLFFLSKSRALHGGLLKSRRLSF